MARLEGVHCTDPPLIRILVSAESDDEWFDALEDVGGGDITFPATPTEPRVDEDGEVTSAIKLDLKFDIHKVRN